MHDRSNFEARRFADYEATAIRRAEQRGHQLGAFEFEVAWYAAVTTCVRCRLLAAIDLTERPYLFGRAYKKDCAKGRAA